MKLIIQRVKKASVLSNGVIVGDIGSGLLILLGFSSKNDNFDTEINKEKLEKWANKVLNLRIFNDSEGKSWKNNVRDNGFEILVVSQFTLYAKLNGNKPDFHNALISDKAKILYEDFINILKQKYDPSKIKNGNFGNYMEVSLINDGPVTITIDCDN